MPTNKSARLKALDGVASLSRDDYNAFIAANQSKIAAHNNDPLYIAKLYRNKQYIDTFGLEDFKLNTDPSYREEKLRANIIEQAWEDTYSPKRSDGTIDPNKGLGNLYDKYSGMTPESKLKVLNSDYVLSQDLKARQQEEAKKDSSFAERVQGRLSGEHKSIGLSDILDPFIYSNPITAIGAFTAEDARDVVRNSLNTADREHNDKILEDIYIQDLQSRTPALTPIVQQVYNTYYSPTVMSDEQVEQDIAKESTKGSYTHENGVPNFGIPEYWARSQWGSSLKDLSIDDKRKLLAKKKVYDHYLGPYHSTELLDHEIKKYASDHQSALEQGLLFMNDLGVSAASYTADKVNGVYDLGLFATDLASDTPVVYVDDRNEILPKTKPGLMKDRDGSLFYIGDDNQRHNVHPEKISRATLHQMGKDSDGEPLSNFFNPDYWNKVDMYKTFDSDELQQYTDNNASPLTVAWDPDEENHILYESLKMSSFGLADTALQLLPYGVGQAGKAISTMNKLGKIGRSLGKVLQTSGKILSNSKFQGVLGAVGIAHAYERGAFQETLSKNLSNLDEEVHNKSFNEITQQYQEDSSYHDSLQPSILQKATELEAQRLASLSDEQRAALDTPEGRSTFRRQALEEAEQSVLDEEIKKRVAENKQSEDFRVLQEEAIQSAGRTALTTFLPEAAKYSFVNTLGFRKYLYKNPTSFVTPPSELKGLREITASDGKLRLTAQPTQPLTKGAQWKQIGKIAGSQIWGGAWTNGTDDMMVDAAEQINDDSFNRYLQAYRDGTAMANLYDFADGLHSYWQGFSGSLGQATTRNAALVGGLGSVLSFSPNAVNMAHLLTKSGREQYKSTFQQRNKYDEQGLLVRDESGKPITEKVSWKDNWKDRLSYFVQNGVLNNYYGAKQQQAVIQDKADYVNKILDDQDDFKIIEELIASDIASQDAQDVQDPVTGNYLKALSAVTALEQLGNDKNDPAFFSSVVQNNKSLLDRVTQIFDPNKRLSDEETDRLVSEFYANNPGLPRSPYQKQKILYQIAENAQELKDASAALTAAEEQVQTAEKALRFPIDPYVRYRLKINHALRNHWNNRLEQLHAELEDSPQPSSSLSGDALLATTGSFSNARHLLSTYDKREQVLRSKIDEQAKQVEALKKEQQVAQLRYKYAPDSQHRLSAQQSLEAIYGELSNATQQQSYLQEMAQFTKNKRETLQQAYDSHVSSETGKPDASTFPVLTSSDVFNLDPLSRAYMLHPDNRVLYSESQQQELSKLERELQLKDSNNLQRIQEVGLLTQRVANSEDAYYRILKNPVAAAVSFDAQRDAALNASYNLINYRRAGVVADYINALVNSDTGMEAISQEVKDQHVYRLLRQASPALLKIIQEEEMLPQYQQQLHDAEEWGAIVSDMDAVIQESDKDQLWKDTVGDNISRIIDDANNRQEVIATLEQVVDDTDTDNTQAASDIEMVLQGLEKLGYQRDATVIEQREKRRARQAEERAAKEAAAKKAQEEAQAEAARRAAEEAEKKQAAVQQEKLLGVIDILGDEEDSVLQTGEQTKEGEGTKGNIGGQKEGQAGNEEVVKAKVTKLKKDVADNTRTGNHGWTNVTVVNPDYNGAPHINIGTYNSAEDWQTSTDYRLNDKGQLEARYENKEWKVIEKPSGYIKEFFDGFKNDASELQVGEKAGEMAVSQIAQQTKDAEEGLTGAEETAKAVETEGPDASAISQLEKALESNDTGFDSHSDTVNLAQMSPDSSQVKMTSEEAKESERLMAMLQRGVGNRKEISDKQTELGKRIRDRIKGEIANGDYSSLVENKFYKKGNKAPEASVNSNVEHNFIDNGETVQSQSPTIEEQAAVEGPKEQHVSNEVIDADMINSTGEQVIDNSATTISGTAMSEYNHDLLKTKGILKHKKGSVSNDKMNRYFAWMDAAGIKLQNIIDMELAEILRRNPQAKVKFMAVRPQSNATHDSDMKRTLFLVLDYDNSINRGITTIHSDENGGVFESNGKKYLVIGVAGYGKNNADKLALYDILFSNDPNKGNGTGLVRRGMGAFFNNNPSERFYVPEGLSTEVVPSFPTPGRIVKQLEGEEGVQFRSVSELLKDPQRNPLGLTMQSLAWGIQEQTKFLVIGTSLDNVMIPRNRERNLGSAFVLIPAGNGKMIPSYLKPLFYAEMRDGRLKDRVNELLMDVVSSNYATRLSAVSGLSQIFYFSNEGDNILLGKDNSSYKNTISLMRGKDILKTFVLNSTFDRQQFMEAVADMNPRINITSSVLQSPTMLEWYDEAGALQTDIARLATAGSSYSIYGVDAQGRMIKPDVVDNDVPRVASNTDFRNGDKTQVIYNHTFYQYDAVTGQYLLDGKVIANAPLIKQLDYNRRIIENALVPVQTEGVWEYYILGSEEHPDVVKVNKNTYFVQEVKDQYAKELIDKVAKEKADKEREEAAKQEAEKLEKMQREALEKEEVKLTEEFVADPDTGELVMQQELEKRKEEEEEAPAEQQIPSQEHTTSKGEARPQVGVQGNTQTLNDIVKSKAHRVRIITTIKNKWPQAPTAITALEQFLRSKNVEVDAIGISDTDVQAWIKTIEDCR